MNYFTRKEVENGSCREFIDTLKYDVTTVEEFLEHALDEEKDYVLLKANAEKHYIVRNTSSDFVGNETDALTICDYEPEEEEE